MPQKPTSTSRTGRRAAAVKRNVRTGTFSKRGGYSSSAKPVSQLKPPPSGSGAGAKKKK